MLSQENIIENITAILSTSIFKEGAIYYSILPYTHLFGLLADYLIPLWTGGCICYGDEFDFFGCLRKYKPTHLNLPPALISNIYELLKISGDFDFATGGAVKRIICGGAALKDDKCNDFFNKNGLRVYATYGQTECAPCVSLESEFAFKNGSCGKVLPCCEVRIIGDEITVRGRNVMVGYYKNEDLTRKTIIDGWLHTGDLGYIDSDGFLYVTGRIKNMIVLDNGKKISIERLEEQIENIPQIKEAQVYLDNNNRRTGFHIDIVPDSNNINNIYEIIKKELSEEMQEYMIGIRICHRLQRNKLGKKIRAVTCCNGENFL